MATMDLLVVMLLISGVVIAMPSDFKVTGSPQHSGGLKCYACTSYVPYCKATVNDTSGTVPHVICKSSCFVREGYEKDLPLYRGCADDFESVPSLDTDYIGCRKQVWNGVERMWCFCTSDMCNGQSMQNIGGGSDSFVTRLPAEQPLQGVPEAREIYQGPQYNAPENIQYRKDFTQFTRGMFQDFHEEYEQPQSYAREGHSNTYSPPVQEHGSAQPEPYNPPAQEHNVHQPEPYRPSPPQHAPRELHTDDGLDKPYYPLRHNKVYTDIEQVQFGQNNDQYGNSVQPTDRPNNIYIDNNQNYPPQQPYYSSQGNAPHDANNVNFNHYESRQNMYEKKTTRVPATVTREHRYQRYESRQRNQPEYNYHFETVTGTPPHPSVTPKPLTHLTNAPDKIICSHTGFIPNPEDCSTFLACIMDSHIGKPVMHRMRCPDGLYWDNNMRVCVATSDTCLDNKQIDVAHYQPQHTQYHPDNH